MTAADPVDSVDPGHPVDAAGLPTRPTAGVGAGPYEPTVDARGLRCPIPVLRLAQALKEHDPGTVVRLLATDPAAAVDVPALVRMRGLDLLAVQAEGAWTAYLVRVPVAPPVPGPDG